MESKIKIAFILDSYIVPRWKYKIIEDIINSDYSVVSLIVFNNDGLFNSSQSASSVFSLLKLYQVIDKSVFGKKSDYSQNCSLLGLIQNIPTIYAKPVVSLNLIEYSVDTCKSIQESGPDVILKLGYGNPIGDIVSIARYGLWAFTLDYFDTDKLGHSWFNLVLNKSLVANCDLVLVGGAETEPALISRTVENICSYSVHITRERFYARASLMPSRILKAMNAKGYGFIESIKSKFPSYENRFIEKSTQFTLKQQTGFIWKISFQILQKIRKKIFYTDPFNWILLFKSEAERFISTKFGNFIKIKSPNDKFWADPFIIQRDNKFFVFVEEFIYRKNKGHISVIELDRNGVINNVNVIIEKTYHLSYPFVFESDGMLYMIPESSENKTIDIYKCIDFPGQWAYQKTIMQGLSAFDTTLFYFNGKWWMFTLVNELKDSKDESPDLFLFYSDNFLSDKWTSHPLNPIVSDIRSARPAGKVFLDDGKIIRPSQDCSGRYGRAFNYNIIHTLSENEYSESISEKVEPKWDVDLKGTHTFNSDGKSVIIDAYSFRLRYPFSLITKKNNYSLY